MPSISFYNPDRVIGARVVIGSGPFETELNTHTYTRTREINHRDNQVAVAKGTTGDPWLTVLF